MQGKGPIKSTQILVVFQILSDKCEVFYHLPSKVSISLSINIFTHLFPTSWDFYCLS